MTTPTLPYPERCMAQIGRLLLLAGERGLLVSEIARRVGECAKPSGVLRRRLKTMQERGYVVTARDRALPRSPCRVVATFWTLTTGERAAFIQQMRGRDHAAP